MACDKANKQAYGLLEYHRVRMAAVMALGGECVVCGYDDERALHIDHVHGGGARDRKVHGTGKSYLRHVAADTTGKYQLLCANCHYLKSHAAGECGRPRHKLQDTEKQPE